MFVLATSTAFACFYEQPIPCEVTYTCEEPSPTPEPEGSPVPLTQGAEGCSQDCHPGYNPPACVGVYADRPVFAHVDRVSSTEVKVQWATNNSDSIDLVYGYVNGPMEYGVSGLPGSAREFNIGNLAANRPINVQVIAWRAWCSIGSEVIDP